MSQVTGKVKVVQSVIEKGTFKSRNIVVTTAEQYPQDISIQFVQDKCDLLNNFKAGDNVEVDINLRGREWINPQGEAVYFNTIQGWKIFKQQDSNSQPAQSNEQPIQEESDDSPF